MTLIEFNFRQIKLHLRWQRWWERQSEDEDRKMNGQRASAPQYHWNGITSSCEFEWNGLFLNILIVNACLFVDWLVGFVCEKDAQHRARVRNPNVNTLHRLRVIDDFCVNMIGSASTHSLVCPKCDSGCVCVWRLIIECCIYAVTGRWRALAHSPELNSLTIAENRTLTKRNEKKERLLFT